MELERPHFIVLKLCAIDTDAGLEEKSGFRPEAPGSTSCSFFYKTCGFVTSSEQYKSDLKTGSNITGSGPEKLQRN